MRTHDEMEMMRTVPLVSRVIHAVVVRKRLALHAVVIRLNILLEVILESLHYVCRPPLNVVLSLTGYLFFLGNK